MKSEKASSPTGAVTVTIEGTLGDKQGYGGVLSQVLLFHLDLAIRAGRRWGSCPLNQCQVGHTYCQATQAHPSPISLPALQVVFAPYSHS
jgi:hypothetical protein